MVKHVRVPSFKLIWLYKKENLVSGILFLMCGVIILDFFPINILKKF